MCLSPGIDAPSQLVHRELQVARLYASIQATRSKNSPPPASFAETQQMLEETITKISKQKATEEQSDKKPMQSFQSSSAAGYAPVAHVLALEDLRCESGLTQYSIQPLPRKRPRSSKMHVHYIQKKEYASSAKS